MDILITGGTGLIGRALVAELVAREHKVTILSRNPEKHKGFPSSVTLTAWEGKSPEGWGSLIESTDAVINLAGASIGGEDIVSVFTQRWNDENKRRILESRLSVGQALTEAIRPAENKPKVLLQVSAVGYYGPHGSEPLDEKAPPGNDFQADVCQAWEGSTKRVEGMGVRHLILRTGLVMSLKGGVLPMMLLPFRLFVGGPLGSGQQYISWIHMRDQVAVICFLIEHETAAGVYNATAPQPVTNAQFSEIAGKALHRPSFLPVPGFAMKLLLGEKAALVLDGQRVLPERLLAAGYEFIFPEMEPALRDLLE